MASVFSSHPDESNIVKKIIATNVERSVVFMGLTRIEQIGNLRDGRDSARDKPRLALNNITAGVREGEDANRTRVAGHLDEIQGVVANAELIPQWGRWLHRLVRCRRAVQQSEESA